MRELPRIKHQKNFVMHWIGVGKGAGEDEGQLVSNYGEWKSSTTEIGNTIDVLFCILSQNNLSNI